MRKCVVAIAVSASAVMFGYAYNAQPSPTSSDALARSYAASTGPAAAIARIGASGDWGSGSISGKGVPYTLVQATPTPAQEPDATSAATAAEAENAEVESADATSAATGESSSDVNDPAYCLKCHGPFEKLQARTKDYVTGWDEKANPHVYVPHESDTLVACTECHDPHAIPYKPSENTRTPNVDYCYSCHHAETLVNCNQCHNE